MRNTRRERLGIGAQRASTGDGAMVCGVGHTSVQHLGCVTVHGKKLKVKQLQIVSSKQDLHSEETRMTSNIKIKKIAMRSSCSDMEGFGDLTSSSVLYEKFVTMDDDIVVCRELRDAEILAEVVSSRMHSSGSSDEENDPSELSVQLLPTSVETMEYIHELRRYFEAQQNVIQFSNHLISLKIL
ncbi:hypothetical protein PR048_006513 [Dryococelus australis]|uniref:Uncharacterized protein n=1 Tax=Dryococelus australis TaxID=614101 RepID=A0ABQ9IB67_9NEOP|nr:hypothetical protein PR048_006513 [Dryococelus australis]